MRSIMTVYSVIKHSHGIEFQFMSFLSPPTNRITVNPDRLYKKCELGSASLNILDVYVDFTFY